MPQAAKMGETIDGLSDDPDDIEGAVDCEVDWFVSPMHARAGE